MRRRRLNCPCRQWRCSARLANCCQAKTSGQGWPFGRDHCSTLNPSSPMKQRQLSRGAAIRAGCCLCSAERLPNLRARSPNPPSALGTALRGIRSGGIDQLTPASLTSLRRAARKPRCLVKLSNPRPSPAFGSTQKSQPHLGGLSPTEGEVGLQAAVAQARTVFKTASSNGLATSPTLREGPQLRLYTGFQVVQLPTWSLRLALQTQ